MKLSKVQYREIEVYLENKGVSEIDLKFEISDHIVSGIESNIDNKGLSFQKSFELEQIKWQSELDSYNISPYNIGFKTPKIVLRRYWEVIRDICIKAMVMTLGASLSITMFIITDMVPVEVFNTVFGYSCFLVFVAIVIAFVKLKKKDTNTIDSKIFKATMGCFLAWLVVFNPFLTKM